MEENKMVTGFSRGTRKRDFLVNLGVDEKIKLIQILKEWNGRPWT
jgi:hypothetical protein